MKVAQLDSFEQIRELGVRWNDLVEKSREDHIFLTLEWLSTWWKHFGANRKLVLLAVKDDRRVLAIAPLMNSTYRFSGLKLKKIEFVGTPTSDYHSFVLTEKSRICVKMFLDYIRNCSWDCVELKSLREHGESANLLRAASGQSLRLEERVLDICPFVPLPHTFEEYLRDLRKKVRQDLRRYERELGKEHKVGFKLYKEIGSLEEAMRIFFKLHQARWQYKGDSGMFSNQIFNAFHLEIAKRFADKGWLHLYFLTVDDEPVSVWYSFGYKQKLFSYMTGFDPAYSRYGVGKLCIVRAIKHSIERGLTEFDFMRGGHFYKSRFNVLIRRNIELGAIRCKPVPKFYDWLVRGEILPSLSRRLRERVTVRKGRNEF